MGRIAILSNGDVIMMNLNKLYPKTEIRRKLITNGAETPLFSEITTDDISRFGITFSEDFSDGDG